jgi:hypothetical protein
MSKYEPPSAIAVNVTGTPVIVSSPKIPLIGIWLCKYSIQVAMLSLETHGVPGWAGDIPKTDPLINIVEPFETTS